MTLHHVVQGLTSRPSAQSLTPAPTSSTQTAEEAKEAAVPVDSTHSPSQEPKAIRHAEGKQLPETSTAVQTQSNNVAGMQQHIEQITKDNDCLTKENNRLAKENDCLAEDKNRLTKTNDRLTNGYNKLSERYNKLKEDNDQIAQEIRQLKKQLVIVDEQSNTAETQKLINHLTTENEQLKEAREAAIEKLKAQPIMQDMINKLVKEKEELEEKFRASHTSQRFRPPPQLSPQPRGNSPIFVCSFSLCERREREFRPLKRPPAKDLINTPHQQPPNPSKSHRLPSLLIVNNQTRKADGPPSFCCEEETCPSGHTLPPGARAKQTR
ncbi:hypothetical protein BZA77DRAFT_353572 [Pyronema omphalodes]|nr:hypothetical protein BZA77DRAFT_353572 [Pyronema omphalodes]